MYSKHTLNLKINIVHNELSEDIDRDLYDQKIQKIERFRVVGKNHK